jgi:hypothetical protein
MADLQSVIQGQNDCENAITFDSAVTGAVRDPDLAALIQSWPQRRQPSARQSWPSLTPASNPRRYVCATQPLASQSFFSGAPPHASTLSSSLPNLSAPNASRPQQLRRAARRAPNARLCVRLGGGDSAAAMAVALGAACAWLAVWALHTAANWLCARPAYRCHVCGSTPTAAPPAAEGESEAVRLERAMAKAEAMKAQRARA